jgi:hypothetical protein
MQNEKGNLWIYLEQGRTGAFRPDPGCTHGKLNSELLLYHKSRADGSNPRETGAKFQGHLTPDCPTPSMPSEGWLPGIQVCRIGIRFQPHDNIHFYKPSYFVNFKMHPSSGQEMSSIIHQKAERLE